MHTKKLAAVLGVMLSAGVVMAQSAGSTQAPGDTQAMAGQTMGGNHHKPMDPDKAAKRLGKKLNLSADQVSQIKPILADRQQQMQALRADSTLSQQDRHAKAQSIMQDSKTKLEAVMNDQQKQEFEQMMAERQAHHHNMNEKPQAQ